MDTAVKHNHLAAKAEDTAGAADLSAGPEGRNLWRVPTIRQRQQTQADVGTFGAHKHEKNAVRFPVQKDNAQQPSMEQTDLATTNAAPTTLTYLHDIRLVAGAKRVQPDDLSRRGGAHGGRRWSQSPHMPIPRRAVEGKRPRRAPSLLLRLTTATRVGQRKRLGSKQRASKEITTVIDPASCGI